MEATNMDQRYGAAGVIVEMKYSLPVLIFAEQIAVGACAVNLLPREILLTGSDSQDYIVSGRE